VRLRAGGASGAAGADPDLAPVLPPRRSRALGLLLAGEVAAVLALQALGRVRALQIPWHARLLAWLLHSPLQVVLGAVGRLAALLLAWWLLASTVLYLLAAVARVPGAVTRLAASMALPLVRRVADQALALGIATSIVGSASAAAAGPAAALPAGAGGAAAAVADAAATAAPAAGAAAAGGAAGQHVYTPKPAGASAAVAGAQGQHVYTPKPAGFPPRARAARPPRTTTPRRRAPTTRQRSRRARAATGAVHRVARGENLWMIARDHLAAVTGRPRASLRGREIARYWLRVIAANRGSFASGDPDVIYPGERVRLPRVS
jgi:hypothetical protein